MPFYCYRDEEGNIYERQFRIGQAPETIEVNGKTATRFITAEHKGFRHTPGTWPMVSTAMGVAPEQREEAMREAAKMGIPTEFNEDGDAIFRSRAHRKAYCRAFGVFDRDGGYSDP